jgi:broad specificity phosphatase PhoE
VTRLLLVRHGQSEWNAAGRWQGQADPPLSRLGERQAEAAAERLAAVDAIVTSDLQRASRTAEIIGRALGIGPLLTDADLRERDVGEWQGLTRAEIEERWPGHLAERRVPPGFESDASVLERALRAIGRVIDAHRDRDVLVVTHGGLIYTLEVHLGATWAAMANLEARWVEAPDRELQLGERLLLVDPDDAAVTVPRQL